MYFTEGQYRFIIFVIVVTAFVGLVGGYLCGSVFMAPSPEDIADALEYPSLYEDEVLEKHWNGTCTAVTLGIWVITLAICTLLYFKAKTLEMLEKIISLQPKTEEEPSEEGQE